MNIWQQITKKRSFEDSSVLESILSYLILGIWAFICIFPIYWVLVTSVKEPHVVNQGPFYIPFVDFQPSLHAWEFVFMQESMNTLRPFFNTVIISLISAFITLLIGSMAGYALVREDCLDCMFHPYFDLGNFIDHQDGTGLEDGIDFWYSYFSSLHFYIVTKI